MTAEWLTVPQVAERMGGNTSERYVLDELRRKNLRGTKLAGRAGWRITPSDLKRYMDAKANVSPVRGRA